MEISGLDIVFYDDGWRYAKLLSHDGTTALVQHPVEGKKRVKLINCKVYREEESARMPDFFEGITPATPATETAMTEAKKKSVKKTKKVVELKQRAGSRIAALSAGTDLKDFKEGSHGYYVVKALAKLGKGTAAEITAEAIAQGLKTTMDPAKAIAWMVNKMFTEKKLKAAGETKPAETAVA